MFFNLKISCKDERIIKKFLRFLIKIEFLPIHFKSFSKPEKRKFVTVLKSPHVNKTAQEQFEYRIYTKQLFIRSFKPLTFFLFLKKVKNQSFPGLSFEVKGVLGKNDLPKYALKIVSPDNLILKSSINLSKKKKCEKNSEEFFKTYSSKFLFHKKYLQLFDLHGEIYLKTAFYL